MSRPVRVGIIGCGTVGTGVLKILQSRPRLIEQLVGARVQVKWVCDKNTRPRSGVRISKSQFISDPERIFGDPDVDIVVELIGGYEPARRFILSAIGRGKHVVTANKAVLAKHWGEVMSAASHSGVLVYFEAAVGGGIPVIQALNEGLAANRISSIIGILNGTTNYILTKMSRDGMSFDRALKQAQELGFAEADPTFDINGMDAAHKIAILASIAFGGQVPLKHVYAEGIRRIHSYDIKCGRQRYGFGLKLLAIAQRSSGASAQQSRDSGARVPNLRDGAQHERGGKLSVRVHPAFIPLGHPLNACENEFNAVYMSGDLVGQTMLYGKGAGQLPAASAVVSDLIFLARRIATATVGEIPYVRFDPKAKPVMLPMDEHRCEFYLRFSALDRPGVLSKLAGILGRNGVSIAHMVQEPHLVDAAAALSQSSSTGGQPGGLKAPAAGSRGSNFATLVMVTHSAREGSLRAALDQMASLKILRDRPLFIRIERPE